MAIEKQAVIPQFGFLTQLRARLWTWLAAHPRIQTAGLYLCAAGLGVWIYRELTWVRRVYLPYPFVYHSDALFYHIIIKSVLDYGWFLDIPALNAPEGLNMRDVPTSDNNLFIALIKLLGLFTDNYALIFNLFFLLSLPLTVLSALYVLRHFGVSWPVATASSLLYTYLPFHFMRGQHHLFLSSYYFVPLAVLLVLWLGLGKLSWGGWRAQRGKLLAATLICLALGSTGYYYAFFTCFLLLIAGLTAWLQQKRQSALLLPFSFIALLSLTVIINLWPSIDYQSREGGVPVVERKVSDADIYSLRIAQLLLPLTFHRQPQLAAMKYEYNQRAGINENDDASLGFLGSLGFLTLLVWFFYRKPEVERLNAEGAAGVLNHLSLLTLASLLLAVVGSFNSLVAFFIVPQIRAYTRISIFIAFFSFFALALLLDRVAQRCWHSRRRQVWLAALLIALVAFGVWDSFIPRFIPQYDNVRAEFRSDDEFIRRIEAQLPRGAMVFQLPVALFPENPKIHQLLDYDLARGYLHSQQLRWSYGAIKGRKSEVWQRLVAEKPPKELLETLALSGFSALYVDRKGYPDRGAKLEAEAAEMLQAQPHLSDSNRYFLFDLTAYQRRLQEQYTAVQRAARLEELINPVLAVWRGSFSFLEYDQNGSRRWCGQEGELLLINHTPQAKEMKLTMELGAGAPANLTMESAFFNERVPVHEQERLPFTRTLTIPPGNHPVRFYCAGRRIYAPNDFRELVFYIYNFKLTPAAAESKPALPEEKKIEEKKIEEKKVKAAGAGARR